MNYKTVLLAALALVLLPTITQTAEDYEEPTETEESYMVNDEDATQTEESEANVADENMNEDDSTTETESTDNTETE